MDVRTSGERPIERTLRRVDADLQDGRTFVAAQRLATLVQRYPTNLSLRSRLAAVHRSTGNLVEAGRWGYLEEHRDEDATLAFERAFPHPRARLASLRWRGSPHEADTILARARLMRMEDAAVAAAPPPAHRPKRGRRAWQLQDFLLFGGLALVVIIWVLGAVSVVRWFL